MPIVAAEIGRRPDAEAGEGKGGVFPAKLDEESHWRPKKASLLSRKVSKDRRFEMGLLRV